MQIIYLGQQGIHLKLILAEVESFKLMTTLNEHTLVIGENLGVNKQKYNKVKYIIIERSVEAHEVLLLSYYICFFFV